MSQTYSLVCHETRKRVWIGQGWGTMEAFYSGNLNMMEALREFLCDHEGKPLVFVCDDRHDEVFEYEAYGGPAL